MPSRATLGGFVAILLWASTIAVVGSLAEDLGIWLSSSLSYALAGGLGLALGGRRVWAAWRLPAAYLGLCGGLFVAYMLLLAAAVGAARNADELMAVALLNYLWPTLTVVFSLPLLGQRARPRLAFFLALACAGAWFAIAGDEPRRVLASPNPVVWSCATAAAVCWALYSNLTRRLGEGRDENAIPLFMLVSSVALLLTGSAQGLELGLLASAAPRTWLALAYLALLPGFLAYGLWDTAMRKGEHALVATASNATPVGSALAIALVHGLPLKASLGLALLLVVAAAFGGRASIRQAAAAEA